MTKEDKKYSILIFEDDIDLAKQWTAALEKKNMQVAHAMTVDSALEFCNLRKFDAIILDVFLQDQYGNFLPKAGYTLLSYLRNTSLDKAPEWGATIPVLAVTGSPVIMGYDILSYAKSLKAQGTMRKPFSIDVLYESLINIIENPHVEPENDDSIKRSDNHE